LNQWIHGCSYSFFPAALIQLVAGPEEAKNLGGAKILRVIQIRLVMPSLANITPVSQAHSLSDRRFEFNKRAQLFVGAHNETLSVAAGPSTIQVVRPLESRG
jgi:hypothetical protein